ncbi:MAG: hypothetical protein WC565_00830 [Parcubacteria group bacterium]
MTILRPNDKRKESAWKAAIFLAGGLLIGAITFCGCIYSKIVSLKHEISSLKNSTETELTANAELKNTLFKITDPQALETIAEEKGLVLDKNPQWVFASLQ